MWLYMKTSKESLKQKENRTNYVYAVPSMSLDAFMAALVCKLAYCRGKKKRVGGEIGVLRMEKNVSSH